MMAIPSNAWKVTDYLDGFSRDSRPSDRIVEKYLQFCVNNGLYCGKGSAGTIRQFMRINNIDVPQSKPIKWLNTAIRDAIHGGIDDFEIKEIEGIGTGMVFAWWYECIKQSESQ